VENAIVSHPAVAEAGVCGVPDELRGEVAAAFVVLKPSYQPSDELKNEIIQHVRKTFGPLVVFRGIEFVNMLPKTKSGKIMRRVMKKLWTGEPLGDLSTLEAEASVDEIKEAVSKLKRI
jgi:acetyl-CoA synthetase